MHKWCVCCHFGQRNFVHWKTDDKSSSKPKSQACKQQQTALDNNNCACAYSVVVLGPITMKQGTLTYHKNKKIIVTTNSLRQ